jgi:hypothetical protein
MLPLYILEICLVNPNTWGSVNSATGVQVFPSLGTRVRKYPKPMAMSGTV